MWICVNSRNNKWKKVKIIDNCNTSRFRICSNMWKKYDILIQLQYYVVLLVSSFLIKFPNVISYSIFKSTGYFHTYVNCKCEARNDSLLMNLL